MPSLPNVTLVKIPDFLMEIYKIWYVHFSIFLKMCNWKSHQIWKQSEQYIFVAAHTTETSPET